MAPDADVAPAGEWELWADYPSGWLALTRYGSVPHIIDALIDLLFHREVNPTELADFAGVSRQSVGRHLDLLLATEVIEPVGGTNPQRYRFAPESDVNRAIIQLDGAVNAVGPFAEG